MEHRNIPAGHIHMPFNWVVADAAELDEITVSTSDLHRLCLQLDTGAIYRLSKTLPKTWTPLPISAHSHDIADVSGLSAALSGKETSGAASAAILAHVSADDPHEQYALASSLSAHAGSGGEAHAEATDEEAGFMSSGDKAKLDSIAEGATANSSDEDLLDRQNHTGTQGMDTIEGLEEALSEKADDSAVVKLAGAQTMTGQKVPHSGSLTDDSTVDWDGDTHGQVVKLTTAAARTFNAPSNIKENAIYVLRLTTGGYTPAWNSAFKWPSGGAPSGLASGTYVFTFIGGASNTLIPTGPGYLTGA